MNKVLVVIDMQNDFINPDVLGTLEAGAIIERVREKVDLAHFNGERVIFTQDTHDTDYLSTQEGRKLPVEHCIVRTPGWAIHPRISEIIDVNEDVLLVKPTFGCTELIGEIDYMIEQEGDIDEIELVGLCTGICVIANAVILKTAFTEIPIKVDATACACVTPQSHKTALEAMKLLQIEITGG